MAAAIGTPSTFTLNVDLSQRRVSPAPATTTSAAPVETYTPDEQQAVGKLLSRAQMLAAFQAKPDSIAGVEDGFGKQKKDAFESLEKAYLKTHSQADEDKLMATITDGHANLPKGTDTRAQDTVAMARLLFHSLKTPQASKLEAEVVAGVEGGLRAGGAKYDLTHPAAPAQTGVSHKLF